MEVEARRASAGRRPDVRAARPRQAGQLLQDFTLGAWREGTAGPELVRVGKAYSGYTDAELLQLDRWIRDHTTRRYGPVREVTPALVLEVALDFGAPLTRHKSGVAMRFRIHRIRWDKPAAEADRLERLEHLIG